MNMFLYVRGNMTSRVMFLDILFLVFHVAINVSHRKYIAFRPGHNGRHSADDFFKCMFINENNCSNHDDVSKWKHFPRNWPLVRGIHRSPVNCAQRPVTRSFDIFFGLRLNKRLGKQS